MNLPNDLKDYRADDPFVILSPDACVLILCALAAWSWVIT